MLDFLGIGAQKAGTTWLYENLKRHQEIHFPSGKEMHFWDMFYERGVPWYQSVFEGDNGQKKGEITPAYAFLPVEKIREIYALYPKLKLIYFVRNPMDRAWSSALMALKRAEMTIEEASDQWFIDHFQSKGSLARGDYQACIKTWLSVFPKEQLLIQKFEDIKHQPGEVLTQCCRHLGVNPLFFEKDPLVNEKVHEGSGNTLRASLKPVLEELYRPKMVEFERFLSEISHISNAAA